MSRLSPDVTCARMDPDSDGHPTFRILHPTSHPPALLPLPLPLSLSPTTPLPSTATLCHPPSAIFIHSITPAPRIDCKRCPRCPSPIPHPSPSPITQPPPSAPPSPSPPRLRPPPIPSPPPPPPSPSASPPANSGNTWLNSWLWTTLPKRAPTTCLRARSCRLQNQHQHRHQHQQRHPKRPESRGPSATAAINSTGVGNTVPETRAAAVYVLDIPALLPASTLLCTPLPN